ncbi:MAG: hypothetical protein JXA58_01180 [Dehalococcoidia bacterium]|nr:hypothetical protein [Dehalococcoidia bacterium]
MARCWLCLGFQAARGTVGLEKIFGDPDMERDELIHKVYEVLPNLECGWCGYGNCHRFARAVVDGRASPSDCRQDPLAALKISRILSDADVAHSREVRSGRAALDATLVNSIQHDVATLVEDVEEIVGRIQSHTG